ncbi:hypothetical protein C8J36_10138 [Rhizobium sp. PP-F2F-G48]|uniref:hypothetical protein n=1 Tax=Rhizobium sp. PP-F2F-G48 TaxID=2135651 RepID=UPI00104542C1|nr:hypothetical protein [Rhizobium sp. PP-F2F-G48]TCM58140.1 hypothetical protein C8J36_10138 [Rhizobium sp. PP-F2F-G48]
MSKLSRLLPGDPAPELRLSRGLVEDVLQPVVSDQLRLVVLWNGGCPGCLPFIRDLAEISASHGVPCYGVAVMVIHVDRTAVKAKSIPSKAVLALEEPTPEASVLSRGWVTRHWLEASGQDGVPAGFIVDRTNRIAWMGPATHIEPILKRILRGEWNIDAARTEWQAKVSDDSVRLLQYRRDILEATITGDVATASSLVKQAETELPSALGDAEFNILKLQTIVDGPDPDDHATRFYIEASDRFPTDVDAQMRLAAVIVRDMPLNMEALKAILDRLQRVERQWRSSTEADRPFLIFQVRLHLTIAEAAQRIGETAECERQIERASLLGHDTRLDDAHRNVAADESARIRRLRHEARIASRSGMAPADDPSETEGENRAGISCRTGSCTVVAGNGDIAAPL